MFFIFSFTGWVWEVIYIGFTEGVVAKRGMLHGPWLPIYGVGGVLILLLLSRFKENPPLVFILAVLLCGSIEYSTGVAIEMIFRCRWWDYSTKFMNLNGGSVSKDLSCSERRVLSRPARSVRCSTVRYRVYRAGYIRS